MKASLNTLLTQISNEARFVQGLQHGTMSVEAYAPKGVDPQTPHEQDELYFVQSGEADFYLAGSTEKCQTGDCLFVPAGAEHQFLNFTADFVTWVVFWGPKGGESNLQPSASRIDRAAQIAESLNELAFVQAQGGARLSRADILSLNDKGQNS